MAIAMGLDRSTKLVEGVAQWPYKAVTQAMEVIPRTHIQNSERSRVKIYTRLCANHTEGSEDHKQGGSYWGIDRDAGKVVDMQR